MSSKPHILLVHGAWLNPSFYTPLVSKFQQHGYPTLCPILPTCSPSATSQTDLIDDALSIRGVLTRLIEYESKSVIVLMHSYGGLVGSEAIPEDLTLNSRQKRSLDGGVRHLIYMAAFILPPGESCHSFYGQIPGLLVQDGFYTEPDAKTKIFGDLGSEEADAWVGKMVRHPFGVLGTRTTKAAYRYVEATYVIFTEDGACLPEAQQGFADMIGTSSRVRFGAGHMAPLTHAEELWGVVDRAVQAVL